ncbi:MAG: ABC transporter ATP-binding protein [Oscillospiraceae bacterium]
MENLISLKNICKYYETGEIRLAALDEVNLNIKRGEMVSIVGNSGSGKSTLMNIIGCLDTPTRGDYTLSGTNVLNLKDRELSSIRNKTIGFIFQSFNLLSGLTAQQNVELPLLYRKTKKGERENAALNSLKLVGLENRIHHKPSQLSGGQQQRVAIARALAANPELILADEPTGNLDSESSKQIMKVLFDLNEQGHTVVIITHDHKIAASTPRQIMIVDGKISS